MKIVFLNPPFKTEYGRFSRTSRSPAITKSGTIYYPLWLAYAAGVAEEASHEIRLIDACADPRDRDKVYQEIKEFAPQLIVLDTSTPSIYSDVKIAGELKLLLPQSFVALMGTHPTALPEETLSLERKVDAVVRGEADYIIRELAAIDLQPLDNAKKKEILSRVKGLTFRVGDEIVNNPDREQIVNLDELPFLSKIYHKHLDIKKYFFAASDYPEIQLVTSRGCPFRCFFCVYPQTMHKRKFRMRNAKNMADEFAWVVANMPEVKEIGLEDDTFTGHRGRVKEFCRELLERKIKIKWYCNVRADLEFDLMRLMKKAGCVLVTVGYESGDQTILDSIRKDLKVEQIVKFSKDARKAGLLVHSCFMVGNKGESRESLERTLKLALSLRDDTMQFFPLMVYPGTEAYRWAKENHLLTVEKYSDWNTEDGNHNTVIRSSDMTGRELVEWCDRARRAYYLRFSYLWYKLIQTIFRPTERVRNLRTFARFIKFLIGGSFGRRGKIKVSGKKTDV